MLSVDVTVHKSLAKNQPKTKVHRLKTKSSYREFKLYEYEVLFTNVEMLDALLDA